MAGADRQAGEEDRFVVVVVAGAVDRFSVVQRKVLTPNDFTGLDQIRGRLATFETRYNAIARPFTWRFTRADLGDLLRRIDAHDKNQPHALAA